MLATPLTLFPSEAESPDSLCFQGTWKVPAQPQPCAAKDKKQSITGIPDTIQGVWGGGSYIVLTAANLPSTHRLLEETASHEF